jgi:hypothetical protein
MQNGERQKGILLVPGEGTGTGGHASVKKVKQKGILLVPGEGTGTGGHASVKKVKKIENPWEALTHAKYTRVRVQGIELVTSSLALSFLTISPTQHI